MKIALIGDSLTEGRPGISFVPILKEQFPHMTFVNLGNPGESVKSLHTRLLKTKLDPDYDLSFLWIGVNDVYTKLLRVQAQPVAQDDVEFKDYYEKVLALVLQSTKHVVTVTPAIVGEQTDNAPNHEIKRLIDHIESIASTHDNVSLLNIHAVFSNHLSKVSQSDYISTKVMRVMKDVLFYKTAVKIDKLSKKRGLHLTLDGIHLNSAGAEIIADRYASEINRFLYENQEETIQS